MPRLGRREFVARVAGLSDGSRFMAAARHGKGPQPSVEESTAVLDGL